MKKTYEWKKRYEIGVPAIDHQHEYFFLLIKKLGELCGEDVKKSQVVNLLNELVLYAKFHFKSEENAMEEMGYPELEAHKKHHLDLIEELSCHRGTFELELTDLEELVDFLVKWLLNHTIEEDSGIGVYHKSLELGT